MVEKRAFVVTYHPWRQRRLAYLGRHVENEPRTVLVVEDDDFLRETLTDALCEEGFKVASVADGQEALIWLSATSSNPKLILTDLLMPNLDGWQLCERLRADEHWQHIPVVVLSSALHLRAWPTDSLPAGQLRKPPNLTQMFDLLNKLIAAPWATAAAR